MEIALPLDKMTTAEKLAVLDLIWEDLSRNVEDIPVPAWQEIELKKRRERLENGTEKVTNWEEAKQRILDSTS